MKNIMTLLLCLSLFCTGCKKEDKRALAISKIKSAAKLATTETTLTKVILASQDRKFLGIIKLNSAQFAARTKATVKAGIDLQELKKEDVKISGKTIELTLPPVKVLAFEYPFMSYEIDYTITRDAFLNKITVEDHERIYRMAELEIRKNLEFTGIKEATKNRTRQLIESLLKSLGYLEVYIEFKEGEFIEAPNLEEDEIM
jgi:hypothetical protein